LAAGWTTALLDTYKTVPTRHAPGRVLADLAVMIADGGDALTQLATLRDQSKLFGAVASEPTAWRAVDRVDDAQVGKRWPGCCGRATPGRCDTWISRCSEPQLRTGVGSFPAHDQPGALRPGGEVHAIGDLRDPGPAPSRRSPSMS
jgi:hypothetical protein